MNPADKKQFHQELMGLAVPLALQNLLNALVGASDALMLGRLNQDAIAAVSLANQVSFVMSLFNGAFIGTFGVLIAQYWGKKDDTNARRLLGMAIRYASMTSLISSTLNPNASSICSLLRSVSLQETTSAMFWDLLKRTFTLT